MNWPKRLLAIVSVALWAATALAADRVVRVEGVSMTQGETNRVLVVLESLGNEKALGFNLAYDPEVLRFVRAVAGVDSVAVGAGLTVNPNQTTNFGRLGLALSLNLFNTDTYPAGSNVIAEVFFTPVLGAPTGAVAITFTNEPGATEVSDAQANPLTASYIGGEVMVGILTCEYSLNTNAVSLSDAAGSGSLSLTTHPGCQWTVMNTNSWLTILSPFSGAGSVSVNFSVEANESIHSRTGVIVVANQNVTITQEGLTCSYVIEPGQRMHPAAAATNTFSVTTADVCAWTVVNTNAWLTILSGNSGSGSSNVVYALAENTQLEARTGVLVVEGQVFPITQQGVDCSLALVPSGRAHGTARETNSLSVSAAGPCPWNVINTNSWIEIISSISGAGPGEVTYVVAENVLPAARSGTIAVNGQSFSISQQGITCSFLLGTNSATHGPGMETNSVAITTSSACAWWVENTNTWIQILAGSNGIGSDQLIYTVSANSLPQERIGTLLVAGEIFTVTQEAAGCSFVLTPTQRTHGSAAATNSFGITAGACPWTVVNTNSWITIVSAESGSGDATITYTVAANATSLERVGTLAVAGQSFTITQQGISCSYTVSPTRRTHGFGSASNSFTVNALNGCFWTVVNTNSWITLVGNGTGSGTNVVGYLVEANATASERIAFITVEGATIIITQRTSCSFSFVPVAPTHDAGSNTGTVSVLTGAACAWTATTSDTWISVINGSGTGNGAVTYSLNANSSSLARTGTVTVAGQNIPITQAAAPENFVFRSIQSSAPGEISLSIEGTPLGVWELQVSDNLSNWSKLADLTNATGRVDFTSPIIQGSNRFFRAVRP